MEKRPHSFYVLAAFFALFMLFLYGPTITIGILSFQRRRRLDLPMRGVSLHWFRELFMEQAVGDIWGSFRRSLVLGLMVMVATVVISVMAGPRLPQALPRSTALFNLVIGSLVNPSISLHGIGLSLTARAGGRVGTPPPSVRI